MGLFLVYILKSALCLAAFYLFYRLLLSRETFHRFNRLALLGVLVLSCMLPLAEVSMKHPSEVGQTMLSLEPWLLMMAAAPVAETVPDAAHVEVPWAQGLLLVYVAGAVFFVLRGGYSLLRLLALLRSAKREDAAGHVSGCKGVCLLVHDRPIAPFSWMRCVVISRKDLEEDGRAILLHELLLACDITNRYVTCLPADSLDQDCHVVNIVWLPEHKKWAMVDSDMRAYVTDSDGTPLSLSQMRERYINGAAMEIHPLLNEGQPLDYTYYRTYWSKNLYWFECAEQTSYDIETAPWDKRGRVVVLRPEGFTPFDTPPHSVHTQDAERFWAAPDPLTIQ